MVVFCTQKQRVTPKSVRKWVKLNHLYFYGVISNKYLKYMIQWNDYFVKYYTEKYLF